MKKICSEFHIHVCAQNYVAVAVVVVAAVVVAVLVVVVSFYSLVFF